MELDLPFVERPQVVAKGQIDEVLGRYRQGDFLEHALLDLLEILEAHEKRHG
ncbi:hypothetical protein ABXV15_15625 [Exiguobacterium profundum]|uniref:hypothetical protein n=1 Tax=Exiguobacterium profundum TaxID=307643 RepID=UPI00339A835A